MIALASIEQIEEFLKKTRECILKKQIRMIRRAKSMETLNQLGISINDAFTMIEELTFEDYYRGPSPERNPDFPPGDIWEFGLRESDNFSEIYVKLKEEKPDSKMLCLSFHEAEYPIVYPYRKQGGE